MDGDIESTLTLLDRSGVRFVVVGGVAVVLHGYLRLTADLDLVVELEESNLSRAVSAFSSGGFEPRAPVRLADFADAANRRRWVSEKNMQVLSLWNRARPGFEVDLFVEEPFDFGTVYDRALRLPLGGGEIRIAALDDLIVLKRAAARPRDLEDVAALEALRSKSDEDE